MPEGPMASDKIGRRMSQTEAAADDGSVDDHPNFNINSLDLDLFRRTTFTLTSRNLGKDDVLLLQSE